MDAAQEALTDSLRGAFFGSESRSSVEPLRRRIEDHCGDAARAAEAEVTERFKAREAQPGGRRGLKKLGRYVAEAYTYSDVKEDCLLDHASANLNLLDDGHTDHRHN